MRRTSESAYTPIPVSGGALTTTRNGSADAPSIVIERRHRSPRPRFAMPVPNGADVPPPPVGGSS